MGTILFAVASIISFRFRSRAALELELIALQHQLAVLRRQRPGRPQLSSLDRLPWMLLYRSWPQVIDAMVLVKPGTVIEWYRRGFRLYWRWRGRGRPRIGPDIRDLIRRGTTPLACPVDDGDPEERGRAVTPLGLRRQGALLRLSPR